MTEAAYGIVPVRSVDGVRQILLIQAKRRGTPSDWGFPKGHKERKETDQQAAERELREETGLRVSSYVTDQFFTEQYDVRRQRGTLLKTNTYFVAEVTGVIKIQPREIAAAEWLNLSDAMTRLTFPGAKSILTQVMERLGWQAP